jgi:hypothetical protein
MAETGGGASDFPIRCVSPGRARNADPRRDRPARDGIRRGGTGGAAAVRARLIPALAVPLRGRHCWRGLHGGWVR